MDFLESGNQNRKRRAEKETELTEQEGTDCRNLKMEQPTTHRTLSVTGHIYKREPSRRVFVNRSLMLEKVKFFGFDMDYTLVVYKSPEYEILGFNHLKHKLVQLGYPKEIAAFEYDPTFPIRGLWFDNTYGTLLKVDGFGNIMLCVRGFHFMRSTEIHSIYPTKFVQMEESRFQICNTLYELPLIYILACLIDYFTSNPDYVQTDKGVKVGDVTMTFESIFNDVKQAMDYVHSSNGPLKLDTIVDVAKYVEKDDRLPVLLTRLREQGKKVFLATNSDYKYTHTVMSYLFDTETNPKKDSWITFFDFIVVDARKPLFFSQGTVLREVNVETGGLHLGTFTGKIRSNAIYSGGSVDVFNEMMGMVNSSAEVLYVGDHIFGDILKSKKTRGWRTFLVVPEMLQELAVWTQKSHLFYQLSELDAKIAEIYRHMDSSDTTNPDITKIKKSIRDITYEMDMAYGKLGSVFRSGSHQTFFATQVMRYADLYAASIMNLIHYPLTYCFRSPAMHMPHESTVDHEAVITDEKFRQIISNWKARAASIVSIPESKSSVLLRSDSTTQRLFCNPPNKLTEVSDDFLADEEMVD